MSENRVAAVSIVVEKKESTEKLNAVLHEFGEYIIGRMGIPYKPKGISVLSVVLDATGEQLGTLDHVLFHGEQEVWSILTPDGKEILLPAVPEFVADIDLDAEIIRITPPEGLLELYL